MNFRVEIETARFLLRELTEADATLRYLNWLANPEARRFIVAAQQTQELCELAEYVRQRTNKPDVLFLGIFEKSTGLHIGNIKYEPINFEFSYAIMGILIGDTNFRGKKVAAEVIKASAIWLKENFSIKQILLGVDCENNQAIHSYKNIGFQQTESQFIKKGINGITMSWLPH